MIYVINESNDKKNNIKIKKTKSKYYLYLDGNQVSNFSYYDYSSKGFDWILLADVYTEEEYRGHGYAKILIDEFCKDIEKKYHGKLGTYVFVYPDNTSAIKLYTKCGFSKVKNYTMKNGQEFVIMAKGNKNNFHQFDNRDFSG